MQKIYIHPLPVRIWHWTNALGFVLLIATGLQLRYMDLAQIISFRWAVTLHNWIGFVLIANFFGGEREREEEQRGRRRTMAALWSDRRVSLSLSLFFFFLLCDCRAAKHAR